MSSPILSVKNLAKTYPNGVQALKSVSFQLERGEFVAVIGLSGAGKSTLLRCLNRLQDPTSGAIFFENQDIAKIQGSEVRKLRKHIGMIFQNFNLIPRQSVLGNVLMGRLGAMNSISDLIKSLFGVFSEKDRQKAHEYLKLVGIADKARMRADQLSGGQQQRVAIARALMQEPAILLADEPVASLDPSTCHTVMEYLKKVNQELGITIICNLHDLNLVKQYATRVIALNAGEIVFQGKPSELSELWYARIYLPVAESATAPVNESRNQ